MHAPPLDYAVDDADAAPAGAAREADVTLAAVFDRHAAALPVTEAMIRDAWRRMESEQRLAPGPVEERAPVAGVLGRTLRRFRPGARTAP